MLRHSTYIRVIALLAISLASTMLAPCHCQGPDDGCPACQALHLPLVGSALVTHVAPLAVLVQHIVIAAARQEKEAATPSCPPRAPPV